MAKPDQMHDDVDALIERMVREIRTYRVETERLETCIDELKAELRDLLEARGASWSDAVGYARLVSEGERTYYEAAALDQLIIEDPLRYGWLKEYRVKSPIQSRVQVK